jgi:hypothetical protein
MMRVIIAILCGVSLTSACFAQRESAGTNSAAREASVCDLKLHPTNYDGQWVTVRGRVSFEFEDFSLYEPACNALHAPGVWLTFGGDQDEIATYCCGGSTRKKGADIEVGGHRVPLTRDEAFREFLRVLQTQRLRRPDGHECESDECYFFRPVTATITGLFLAGEEGDEKAFPGYGHLGCCHLLVISKVADVSAERTSVPAGGQFKCSQEIWKVGAPVATDLSHLLACNTFDDQACVRDRQAAVTRIAANWNDRIDATHGWSGYRSSNGDLTGDWTSADLLVSYSFVVKHASTSAKLSVSRQRCVPVSRKIGTNRPSDHLSCRQYSRSWRDDHDDDETAQLIDGLIEKNEFEVAFAKMAGASKAILNEGDQSWRMESAQSAARHALKEQMQKWGIVSDAALRLDSCRDDSLSEQKWHLESCGWYSRDGTRAFTVAMQKPKSGTTSHDGRDTPWVVTIINATVCD